jgi:hypothetical protein
LVIESPGDWVNPINGLPGQIQNGVDPKMLRPGRRDLIAARLRFQRQLLLSGQARFTPIVASCEGVIIDGHHAVRAAAEEGRIIRVMISALAVPAQGSSILDLHVG